MKVTRITTTGVQDRPGKAAREAVPGAPTRGETVSGVSLSEASALVARLRVELPGNAGVHDLSALRERIRSGAYEVDAERLAEGIAAALASGELAPQEGETP